MHLFKGQFKAIKEIGKGAEGIVYAVEDVTDDPNKREM